MNKSATAPTPAIIAHEIENIINNNAAVADSKLKDHPVFFEMAMPVLVITGRNQEFNQMMNRIKNQALQN
jgi:hypothetical protein